MDDMFEPRYQRSRHKLCLTAHLALENIVYVNGFLIDSFILTKY